MALCTSTPSERRCRQPRDGSYEAQVPETAAFVRVVAAVAPYFTPCPSFRFNGPGALVTLNSAEPTANPAATILSDANGRYTLCWVAWNPTYVIDAAKDGYSPTRLFLQNGEAENDIVLNRR